MYIHIYWIYFGCHSLDMLIIHLGWLCCGWLHQALILSFARVGSAVVPSFHVPSKRIYKHLLKIYCSVYIYNIHIHIAYDCRPVGFCRLSQKVYWFVRAFMDFRRQAGLDVGTACGGFWSRNPGLRCWIVSRAELMLAVCWTMFLDGICGLKL